MARNLPLKQSDEDQELWNLMELGSNLGSAT